MRKPSPCVSTGIALVIALVAGSGMAGADPYVTSVCGAAGGPAQDAWFSVPSRSSLGTAEDLCRAFNLPGVVPQPAVSVFQIYPQSGAVDPREYEYVCPVGATPGVCNAAAGSPAPPEPGCATSACFCVDSGEGFGVLLNVAAAGFTVDGCYAADPLAIAANASYVTSFAPDSGFGNLADMAAAVGLTNTGVVRGTIARLNCATGAFTLVSAGTPQAAAAAFVPGEAYRLRNPSALAYANPTSGLACACTETATYDITGIGDGTDYAWWIDQGKDGVFAAGEPNSPATEGEAAGATPLELAQNLVDSIDLVAAGVCDATLVAPFPPRIEVTCTPCSFDLYIGPATAGAPPFAGQCPVVSTSCSSSLSVRKVDTAWDSGEVPATLTLEPAAGADITLTWEASCIDLDDDYEVYEGALGDFDSHVPVLCTTGGATTATITPAAGNTYYLVTPRNALYEGQYGRDSDGVALPASAAACTVQQAAPPCP